MIRFIFSLTLLLGMLYVLSIRIPAGNTHLPPLGAFLSPSTGFVNNMGNMPPAQKIDVQLPSGKPVQVIFDDRMVPHIFAEEFNDALFAQGYVTAMHRLFQMEFSTLAAAGRLSEVIGDRTLAYDKSKRQIGLPHAARKFVEKAKENQADYASLQAYAAGVNAYIGTLHKSDLPVEYKILDFEPEKWSTYRSALFTKSMVEMLCSQQNDIEYTAMLKLLGPDLFKEVYPFHNPKSDPVISPGTKWTFSPVAIPGDSVMHSDIGATGKSDPPQINDVQPGSNNWALSGSRTRSGAPILCNDPHLRLSLPSIWYECHLVTPDINCYGATLPGTPGIIIGFNEYIAWGSTNVGHDVMDWYKIDWVDETKTHYWLDGKQEEVTYRIEDYKIRGGQTVTDTIRYSIWGPVSEDGKYAGMAMKWMGMEAPFAAEHATFLNLNKARNLEDYLSATDQFVAPLQNFVFASRSGDIAIRVSGQMPLKKDGQGIFVMDGSDSSNDWPGRVPARHNPMEVNPERGFVSSANQVSTDTTYPYFYAGEPYFEDYRGRWLNDQLANLEQADAQDMIKLQQDSRSLRAKELLPTFIYEMNLRSDLTKDEEAILNKLSAWDYAYEANAQVPLYFETWYRHYYENTWDELFTIKDSLNVSWPQSWRTIELTRTSPEHPWFDLRETDSTETAPDIIALSFRKMMSQLLSDGEEEVKTWGAHKNTRITHLTRIPEFSKSVEDVSGHGSALNATNRTNGPSWRMIVEMTDPIQAWVVYPGGQSGHPGSPWYDNMINDWVSGNYYKARFVSKPDELDGAITHQIQFE